MDLAILVGLLVAPYMAVRLFSLEFDRGDAGALGAALLFLATGVAHFVKAEGMIGMLPEWAPARAFIVAASGVFELGLAAALLVRNTRRIAGWTALVFLVGIFPANVYASMTNSPMGGGSWGPLYLLVRAPVQVIFMSWIYGHCVLTSRPPRPEAA